MPDRTRTRPKMTPKQVEARGVARQVIESPCKAMMASQAIPGHVHTCNHKHSPHEDHFCPQKGCLRWWGTKR